MEKAELHELQLPTPQGTPTHYREADYTLILCRKLPDTQDYDLSDGNPMSAWGFLDFEIRDPVSYETLVSSCLLKLTLYTTEDARRILCLAPADCFVLTEAQYTALSALLADFDALDALSRDELLSSQIGTNDDTDTPRTDGEAAAPEEGTLPYFDSVKPV